MLQECKEHGYFREETCPICGQECKFLMNDEEMDRVGRTIAGILRHFPDRFNIEMDEHGWVSLSDLVRAIKRKDRRFRWFRTHHLTAMIDTDPKGRYQIKDDSIRATYGHSVDIELDLPTDDTPDSLYYPTTQEEVALVMETGIRPSDRLMVHLSSTYAKAKIAGLHRVDDPVILVVDAKTSSDDGNIIMRACSSVYLTKEVPPDFVSVAEVEDVPDEEE